MGKDENSIEDDGRSVGMAASVVGSEAISNNAPTVCKVFLMTTNSRYQQYFMEAANKKVSFS